MRHVENGTIKIGHLYENYLELQTTTIYKWLAINWMMNQIFRKWLEITKHPFFNSCLGFQVGLDGNQWFF